MSGRVYLLHFEGAPFQARHYVGWTKRDDVEARVAEHVKRTPIVRSVVEAGGTIEVVAVFEAGRDLEIELKKRHGLRSFCPRCRASSVAKEVVGEPA